MLVTLNVEGRVATLTINRPEARNAMSLDLLADFHKQLDALAPMDEPTRTLLGQAMAELGLSARAYDKIRRVARTIADLENSEQIQSSHVSEAVGYRLLDRKV